MLTYLKSILFLFSVLLNGFKVGFCRFSYDILKRLDDLTVIDLLVCYHYLAAFNASRRFDYYLLSDIKLMLARRKIIDLTCTFKTHSDNFCHFLSFQINSPLNADNASGTYIFELQ